jgi:hypothetical protein
MRINGITGRSSYNNQHTRSVNKGGRKKSQFDDQPLYSTDAFSFENTYCRAGSFGRTMKEIWKYVKKGANFVKTKASNLFKK